jgi:hypothetical protein
MNHNENKISSYYIINPKVNYSQFKLPIKNEQTIKTTLDVNQQKYHDQFYSDKSERYNSLELCMNDL